MPSPQEAGTVGDAQLFAEADHPDRAQSILTDDVADGLVERSPAEHMTNLEDAATVLPGSENRLSVCRGGGNGLFQKDMLAGAKGLLGGETMKMVGQGDEHGIDRWIGKRRREIRARSSFRKVDFRLHLLDAGGCGVDKPGDFNAGEASDNPSECAAAIAEPQNGAANGTVGC